MLPRGSSPTEEKIEHEVDGARKVSGSAYKLTRLRSYHHGTMLLSSDLVSVSALLKSPVKEIINARGVASVPSPVANTGVEREAFGAAAVGEFLRMYPDEAGVTEVTEEEAVAVEAVAVGRRELESQEWVYGQTPRFTIQLPTGGEVVVDKGVVMDTLGGLEEDGIVGEKFGGEVVEKALVNGGMQNWEAREWVDSMIGGRVWGV